jgi:hypothetical protein
MSLFFLVLLICYVALSGFFGGFATFAEGLLVGIYSFFFWPWVLFRDLVLRR